MRSPIAAPAGAAAPGSSRTEPSDQDQPGSSPVRTPRLEAFARRSQRMACRRNVIVTRWCRGSSNTSPGSERRRIAEPDGRMQPRCRCVQGGRVGGAHGEQVLGDLRRRALPRRPPRRQLLRHVHLAVAAVGHQLGRGFGLGGRGQRRRAERHRLCRDFQGSLELRRRPAAVSCITYHHAHQVSTARRLSSVSNKSRHRFPLSFRPERPGGCQTQLRKHKSVFIAPSRAAATAAATASVGGVLCCESLSDSVGGGVCERLRR